jgi:chromosome segregation ATPase
MADEKDPKESIFRRLGGSLAGAVDKILFVHEEVAEEETTTQAETTQAETSKQVPRTTSVHKADDGLVKTILQSAEELGGALNNFEGYVKTFDGIIPDEASRYKAAFAAAKKASPLTVNQLSSAADEQINSLKTEKSDFLEGIKAKNEEVEQLKIEMAQIDEKIVNLKRQIQEMENSKQTKSELIKKLDENIKKGTEKFELALAAVDEILKAKKNKLMTYLKNMQ